MPTDPFAGQMAQLPSMRGGARKALDEIYRSMGANTTDFKKRLNTLNVQTSKRLSNQHKAYESSLEGYRSNAVSDSLAIAEQSSGNVDNAERGLLTQIASQGVTPYQGYAGGVAKSRGTYQKGLRGIDKQYVKDLRGAISREKLARNAELEAALLGYGTSLQANSSLFGAQVSALSQAPVGGGGVSSAEQWLIGKESGGRTNADNPTSSAFGLGQLIRSNREKYAARLGVSPDTQDYNAQLQMFRMYVAERYGSAEEAMRFWQAHGWY